MDVALKQVHAVDLAALIADGDALADIAAGLFPVQARQATYNGATWEKRRGNTGAAILASAVRGATNQSADQTNHNARGVQLVFDITAVPGVQTVLATIQGKDPVSGKYYTILAGAAQVGIATILMRVYPGLTAAANLTANDVLPRTWRVDVTHSGAGNFTYSLGASLIL